MNRFSNLSKANEADRELRQRRRVYPRMISRGKLHKDAADRYVAIMQEIEADYRRLAENEAPGPLFGGVDDS